jgi:hypothetical protein
MALDSEVRHVLRVLLERAAREAGLSLQREIPSPVSSVFLVRSGPVSQLHDCLRALGRLTPPPELAVLGRPGDDLAVRHAWPHPFTMATAGGRADYSTGDLDGRPEMQAALESSTHRVFLCRNRTGTGYDNVLELLAPGSPHTTVAFVSDDAWLVASEHDVRRRAASLRLCDAIVDWTLAEVGKAASEGDQR